MAILIPEGPLKSWVVGSNTVNFTFNRSTLLPGWNVGTSAPTLSGVVGTSYMVDRQGYLQVPVSFDLTWEYLLNFTGTSYGSPQSELAALLTTMVAGQVGTLTVYSVDGSVPLTASVSATARLVNIFDATQSPSSTQKVLNLRWLVPGGFQA